MFGALLFGSIKGTSCRGLPLRRTQQSLFFGLALVEAEEKKMGMM